MLLELIAARHERRSLTANQPFGEWGKMFANLAKTLAAIDRFERARICMARPTSAARSDISAEVLVQFGYRKVDRRAPDGDKAKWYLEPVPELHNVARTMKAEGLSLRSRRALPGNGA